MRNNGYGWFIAGTMLGALGAGLSMGLNDTRRVRQIKRNTARACSRMSRQAGQMISSFGDAVAHKMR